MGRFTRRRFIAASSAMAGTISLAKRFGLAEAAPAESGDLKLWYTKPASQWVDALPIGNGRLGAMVFGGGAIDPADPKDPKVDRGLGPVPTDPAKETLTLNEDTLWSGLPVDGNNLQAKNYLPQIRQAVLEHKDYHLADKLCQKMQGLFAEAFQVVGSLHVDCTHAGEVTEYRRELDLQSAVATTHYKVGDVAFERATFASAPDQAIILRVSASKAGQLNATIWMDGPLVTSVKAVGGNRLLLAGKAPKHVAGAGHPGSETPVVKSDVAGEGMYFSAVLQASVSGGHISAKADRLVVEGATTLTILLTAATGYRGFDQAPDTSQAVVNEAAIRQLDAVLKRSYSSLLQRHVADHRKLFDRVSLRVGQGSGAATPTDERLANFAHTPDPSLLINR
jgi:alpha-L-fucosidase 2